MSQIEYILKAAASSVLLMLTAAFFSGCASASAETEPDNYLPNVDDYSAQAESFRAYETEVTTVTVCSAETETISSADAASSEPDEDNEVAESVLAAISQAMLDASLNGTAPETEETSAGFSAQTEETSASSESAAAPSETSAAGSASETTAYVTVTESVIADNPVPAAPAPSDVYDKEFFSSDLFIGDSITTGYSLYGFLNEANVFAKIGLNPSTVLTKAVSTCYGDITVDTMLSYTSPKRVYIMLGSNGIQWLSCQNMLRSSASLVEIIKTACPDAEIFFVSVPPVTPGYDSTVADVNVMSKINEYNSCLSQYCEDNADSNMHFIDICSLLKDSTGYFSTAYAESDGMHFKSSAYKILLSAIQTEVSEYEASLPTAEEPSETQMSETEAETSEFGTETDESVETTDAESAAETE